MSERLEVLLKKSSDYVMSTWEVQDFLNKISSNYYKLDLLNELNKVINEGTSLKQIVIFDKSFDFNQKYEFLKDTSVIDLTSNSGVKNFFHLGLPIGLLPQTKLIELRIKYILFRDINTYLNSIKVDRLDKSQLKEITFTSFEEAISLIRSNYIQNIELKYEDEEKIFYEKKCEEILSEKLLEYSNYIEKCDGICEFTEQIVQNEKDVYSKVFNSEYKNFFGLFNDNFARLERPVIGVFDNELQQVKILCRQHIHRSSRGSSFLDLKSFSHNSPTIIQLYSGLVFVLPLLAVGIYGYKNLFEKIEGDDESVAPENMIIRMDQKLKDLGELLEEKKVVGTQPIQNKYAENVINFFKDEAINKFNENLNNHEFLNTNIEIIVVKNDNNS